MSRAGATRCARSVASASRETVPDSILDIADEIVLIDLTPEQLRARLAEGKVYLGERAQWAAENFFRESNLTALREMALRLVAERVDRDLREIMSEEKIPGPWKSGDRLLVAVSASPYSERLIRYTRRLAASMEALGSSQTSKALVSSRGRNRHGLTRYLALARQLGAEVITTPGRDVARSSAARRPTKQCYANCNGQTARGRRGSVFSSPICCAGSCGNSGNIDIHMIPAR